MSELSPFATTQLSGAEHGQLRSEGKMKRRSLRSALSADFSPSMLPIALAEAARTLRRAAALGLRTSFVDRKSAAVNLLEMQRADGRLGFRRVRHLNKAEAPRTPGHLVHDDRGGQDLAGRLEGLSQVFLGRVVRQISHKNVHNCSFERIGQRSKLGGLCSDCSDGMTSQAVGIDLPERKQPTESTVQLQGWGQWYLRSRISSLLLLVR